MGLISLSGSSSAPCFSFFAHRHYYSSWAQRFALDIIFSSYILMVALIDHFRLSMFYKLLSFGLTRVNLAQIYIWRWMLLV